MLAARCFASQADSAGARAHQKEKKTLSRTPVTVSTANCVAAARRARSGILTGFPFAARHHRTFQQLSGGLGSTHPGPTAVHPEPFPTSVFKVLI